MVFYVRFSERAVRAVSCHFCFFFFKQKTAYEMRISDWSSDVCSSDLLGKHLAHRGLRQVERLRGLGDRSREHHGPEGFEVTQVHRTSLPIAISYGADRKSVV